MIYILSKMHPSLRKCPICIIEGIITRSKGLLERNPRGQVAPQVHVTNYDATQETERGVGAAVAT